MRKIIQKLNQLKNPESFIQINTVKDFKYDVILEYKGMVSALKSSHKEIYKSYKDTHISQDRDKKIGKGYQTVNETETGTSDS